MNKRARNRLIGITAIILLAIAAIFATVGMRGGSAYNMTVKEASTAANANKRVKVGGTVVNGSWDKKTNPMTFKIRDEADKAGTGPQITVIYTGAVPSTFGDGVTAIVTGELDGNLTIQSGEMITKCPSKYESATGAYTVQQLKDKATTMTGVPLKVAGLIKQGSILPPGGAVRFIIVDGAGATVELNINFAGGIPEGVTDGSKIVLTGELNEDGAFYATEVALEK